MKKLMILTIAFMLVAFVSFAQSKPKSMKQLRDSVFTEMKLSDDSRAKMHALIAENGSGQKAIREDNSLSDADKKAKLKELNTTIREKQKAILTPEQQVMWTEFAKQQREKDNQKKKD